jgi:hypothetical protein
MKASGGISNRTRRYTVAAPTPFSLNLNKVDSNVSLMHEVQTSNAPQIFQFLNQDCLSPLNVMQSPGSEDYFHSNFLDPNNISHGKN